MFNKKSIVRLLSGLWVLALLLSPVQPVFAAVMTPDTLLPATVTTLAVMPVIPEANLIPDTRSADSFTSCSAVTGMPSNECAVLVALYVSTNGSGWGTQTGWLQTNTPCSWYGVFCDSGHVTELNLSHNQLSGSISSQLGSLTSLQYLDLGGNQLSGSIPSQLGNLTNLTELSLLKNNLSGSIPTQLGSLTKLTNLYLYENQLSGSIPTQLGNLINLTMLSLHNNQLSGSLPVSLENLTKLSSFDFDNTNLCIPDDPTFLAWLNAISYVTGTSMCLPPPGASTLVSPLTTTTLAKPTYIWSKVASATYYRLWVKNPGGTWAMQALYYGANICGTTNCAVTPALSLANGVYTWYIQTLTATQNGAWSSHSFTVSLPPPGKSTLVAPKGTTHLAKPTFIWSKVSAATLYRLWIKNSGGAWVIKNLYAGKNICGATNCAIVSPVTLANGAYTWYIDTLTATQNGQWSAQAITVSVPDVISSSFNNEEGVKK